MVHDCFFSVLMLLLSAAEWGSGQSKYFHYWAADVAICACASWKALHAFTEPFQHFLLVLYFPPAGRAWASCCSDRVWPTSGGHQTAVGRHQQHTCECTASVVYFLLLASSAGKLLVRVIRTFRVVMKRKWATWIIVLTFSKNTNYSLHRGAELLRITDHIDAPKMNTWASLWVERHCHKDFVVRTNGHQQTWV